MTNFNEGQISRAIINPCHDKISNQVSGDVIVVGAGPMDAFVGESFMVDKVDEILPGL